MPQLVHRLVVTTALAALTALTFLGCSGAPRTTTERTSAAAPVQAAELPKAEPPKAAAAAPTAMPARSVVEVGDYTLRTDTYGRRIVGWVENTGTVPATSVQVALSLLDENGGTVGAAQSIYTRSVLPPGERSPFLILGPDAAPATWASERLQVPAEPLRSFTANLYVKDLTIMGTNGMFIRSQFGNRYVTTGQVQNEGERAANLVSVTGIMYDTDDAVLAVTNDHVKLAQVGPGMTAPFEVTVSSVATPPARYDLYVQGYPV